MRVERVDGFEAPGLTALALGFGPDDRFPIGREDQSRPGIGELDAVTGRLPDIKKERALDGMLVRTGLDMDAILEENVGRPQDVLARIGGVGDMVEAAVSATMFLSASQIVGLVVDREPATPKPPVVELNHFGDPTAEAAFHEAPELGNIGCQQVEMVDAARTGPTAMVALRQVLQFGTLGFGSYIAVSLPIDLEDVAKGILETECVTMAQVTGHPAMRDEAAGLDRGDPARQCCLGTGPIGDRLSPRDDCGETSSLGPPRSGAR